MLSLKKHLDLLGLPVQDRVTGLKGVVASISFDLYGCIQAIVNPGMDKDEKLRDQHWFDVSRLEVLSQTPVMTPPQFDFGPVADGLKGPSEKPAFAKP